MFSYKYIYIYTKYKAYGIDEIPAKLLKYSVVDIRNELYKICNVINLNRKIASNFEKVLIPKKKGTQKCEEYKTLNFSTQASKIIKNKVDKTKDGNLDKDEFEFSKKHRNQGGNYNIKSINKETNQKQQRYLYCFC